MKTCTKCGITKRLDLFHACKSRPDGRRSICKPCVSDYHKQRNASETRRQRAERRKRKAEADRIAADLRSKGFKECLACGVTKPIDAFHRRSASSSGLSATCKECKSRQDKENYKKNADKIREKARIWHSENRDHANAGRKRRYEESKDDHLAKSREWYWLNRDRAIRSAREWRENNRERHAKTKRAWREKNRDLCRRNHKRWRDDNREYYLARKREYYREWYAREKDTPEFRLSVAMRAAVRNQLKRIGTTKNQRTHEALGYSPEDLRKHLERQFTKGMSWDNYGDWHIDHIVPVAEYIRSGETDPAVINCLTNLRPMWARENQRKNSNRTHLL